MGINFIIIFPGRWAQREHYKKAWKEPGSNDGIAYIISQRYPRLRTSFLFFLFSWFIGFLRLFLWRVTAEKEKKRKLVEIFRGGGAWRREALQERYEEEEKDITERTDRLWYTYMCIYICVYRHASRLPLLKVCQPIDKPRHCISRAANHSSPLQTAVKPAVSDFFAVRLAEIIEHGFIIMLDIHVPRTFCSASLSHLIHTRPIYTACPNLIPLPFPHHSTQPSSSPTS